MHPERVLLARGGDGRRLPSATRCRPLNSHQKAARAIPVPMTFNRATVVCGFEVMPVAVPHDARACAALVLTDQRSGARVGIAMDLGHVPKHLPGRACRTATCWWWNRITTSACW